jgi:hypothetical protein
MLRIRPWAVTIQPGSEPRRKWATASALVALDLAAGVSWWLRLNSRRRNHQVARQSLTPANPSAPNTAVALNHLVTAPSLCDGVHHASFVPG